MEIQLDNILARWKRHFDHLSSEFAMAKFVDREVVDKIYFILLDFWGTDFFIIDFIKVLHENELHLVQSLVYKTDRGSFYKLLEVCFLIDYAAVNNVEQYEKLKSIKILSEDVRNILCEILIEYSFNQAGFDYQANQNRNQQILEGYCTIEGKKFLVECKNKYSISQDELKVISNLTATLSKMAKMIKIPMQCVGYIFFKKKEIRQNVFYKPLNELDNYFSNCSTYCPEFVIDNDELRIEIKPGSEENFVELDSKTINSNLSLSLKNSFQFDDKGNLIFRMKIFHKSSASRKEISKRLLTTISKARNQHSDETNGRIFCICNEFMNDFRPPLLINSEEFVPDVEKYLQSRQTDDIVILVDRRFNLGKPMIGFHVIIANQSMASYKSSLEKLQFYIKV